MSVQEPTRINKYLSEVGYCSRRAADKLIEAKLTPTSFVLSLLKDSTGKYAACVNTSITGLSACSESES